MTMVPDILSEGPLLVDRGNGPSIPYIAEVSFLPTIGKKPGTKHGGTFTPIITNACVDDSIGAVFPELQSEFL